MCKKELLEYLDTMENLILESPELFHDGINQDLIDIIRDMQKEIKKEEL